MSLSPRIALVIARNAHERSDPHGAHFAGDDRKTVRRLVQRGLMVITNASKSELYARITDTGLTWIATKECSK